MRVTLLQEATCILCKTISGDNGTGTEQHFVKKTNTVPEIAHRTMRAAGATVGLLLLFCLHREI